MIENQTVTQIKPRKKTFKRYIPLILILLVIVLAITSAYFYKKSTSLSNQASQAEVRSLIEKVGRLVVLPNDETPTIATVSDPDALKNQAFFANAKKGDKVLIYSNAKKAILYDPTIDKIITIAPLNTEAQNLSNQQSNTPATENQKTTTQKKN